MKISESLAAAIAEELSDPAYSTRAHGTSSAHKAGCTGPLCRKYNRDKVRRTYRMRNPEAKRLRAGSRNPELDQILDAIIQMHLDSKSLSKVS